MLSAPSAQLSQLTREQTPAYSTHLNHRQHHHCHHHHHHRMATQIQACLPHIGSATKVGYHHRRHCHHQHQHQHQYQHQHHHHHHHQNHHHRRVLASIVTSSSSSSSSSSTSPPFIFPPIEGNGYTHMKKPMTCTVQHMEDMIEQAILNSRFLTLMAVFGSLAGSILCFLKGCTFVAQAFVEYFRTSWDGMASGNVILMLVEAVDVYLMGTVMLIFGMGLHELFVNSLDVSGCKRHSNSSRPTAFSSNLFGLFRLRERPKWLEIHSLDELKTKIGHVIVMILLVGMFEKSKKVPIHSGLDLLCFSTSILLSSGCLFLLSKMHSTN